MMNAFVQAINAAMMLGTLATSVTSLIPERLDKVTYAPGGSSASHTHACGVIVYVLAGTLRERFGNGAPITLHQGQAFYERAGSKHVISANASRTLPASFLAAFVCKP